MSKRFLFPRFLAVLLFAAVLPSPLSAFTPPFGECKVKKMDHYSITGASNQLVAMVSVIPTAKADLVKVVVKDGNLVVDTRELYQNNELAGKFVIITFHGLTDSDVAKSARVEPIQKSTNRLTYRVKAEPTGVEGRLFFEGRQSVDGKDEHYWQAEKFTFTGNWDDASIVRAFPVGIRNVWGRFDIGAPGVFTFESVKLSQEELEQPKFDPNRNYINNGGAELGWADVTANSLKAKRSSHNGRFFAWDGREQKVDAAIGIDNSTAHSGKRSFLIDSPEPNSNLDFRYNMVPAIIGQSYRYSVWAKAAEPNTLVTLQIFSASGTATLKSFSVGTQWQKIEYFIPAWGFNHGDGFIIGNILQNSGIETGMVHPGVILNDRKAKVWLDDAVLCIGGNVSFRDDHALYLRGELDNSRRTYAPGAPVKAALELENPQKNGVSGTLRCELNNFMGKKLGEAIDLGGFSLKSGETLKKDVSISLPENFRGPLTATFFAKLSDGKEEHRRFYLGVLNPRPAKPSSRLGFEVPHAQNVEMAISYMLDFGIGAARIGAATGEIDHAFDIAPFFHKAGIKLLCNTYLKHNERDNPELWKAYFDRLGKNIRKCKGMIEAYESQNEANIDNWNIQDNVRQIKALHETVKANDPDAKIAGPTPCSTDFTWIDNVLRNGGAQYLDIVSEHPYRSAPELPDYTVDCSAVERIINLHKPGMRHWGTEAGHVYMSQYPDGEINETTREAAMKDVRIVIQAWAGKVERYHHFAFSLWEPGSPWNVVMLGNPGNDCTAIPHPHFFGFRNLIDRIGNGEIAEQVKLGVDYRCYIFDRGDARVAVLWKWRGAPTTITFDTPQKAFDFGGSLLSGRTYDLDITPLYIESGLAVPELAKMIAAAELPNPDGRSVECSSIILDDRKVALDIKNITGKKIDAEVEILTDGVFFGGKKHVLKGIAPENSARIELETRKPVSTADCPVKLRVKSGKSVQESEINLRGVLIAHTPKALTIDGDLSDWPESARVITLDKRNAVRKTAAWGAEQDKITARLRYAWDADYLYVGVEVDKPDYHPMPAGKTVNELWFYDSIQVCFDTIRNGRPNSTQFDDDDFEYSLGEVAGKPTSFRRWASSAVYDSLAKHQGVVNGEVPFAVKAANGRIVYEAAFSRRAVSPFKLRPYSLMRSSMIVNINDGKDRLGYLELTPGIGGDKTPGLWIDTILMP